MYLCVFFYNLFASQTCITFITGSNLQLVPKHKKSMINSNLCLTLQLSAVVKKQTKQLK